MPPCPGLCVLVSVSWSLCPGSWSLCPGLCSLVSVSWSLQPAVSGPPEQRPGGPAGPSALGLAQPPGADPGAEPHLRPGPERSGLQVVPPGEAAPGEQLADGGKRPVTNTALTPTWSPGGVLDHGRMLRSWSGFRSLSLSNPLYLLTHKPLAWLSPDLISVYTETRSGDRTFIHFLVFEGGVYECPEPPIGRDECPSNASVRSSQPIVSIRPHHDVQ